MGFINLPIKGHLSPLLCKKWLYFFSIKLATFWAVLPYKLKKIKHLVTKAPGTLILHIRRILLDKSNINFGPPMSIGAHSDFFLKLFPK